MERTASDSDVTCRVPQTQQSNQHVGDCIKQELAWECCVQNRERFSETRKHYCGNFDVSLTQLECNAAEGCSASLNSGLQSTCNKAEESLISTIKPVKNEDYQHESELQSVFCGLGNIALPIQVKHEEEGEVEVENHVMYKLESGLGKDEAYDEGRHAGLRASDIEEAGKPHADIFVDVRDIKAEYDTDLAGQATSEQDPQAEAYVCFRCNYSTTQKGWLKKHMKRHVQECSKTKWQQESPVNTKAEPPFIVNLYQCTECDFTTKSESALTRHATVKHDPDAPVYQCAKCDYTTKWKPSLFKHVKVLHDDTHGESYKCPYCDYTTMQKYNLNRHFKCKHDHTTKLYKCTMCDFATKHAVYLIRHVTRKHSLDAPLYQCVKCSYTTKWKEDLPAHIKDHHNRQVHKCPHCDYATKDKPNLNKHMKVRHDPNAKVYNCADCNFTTKHAVYLTRHVKSKHNVNAPVHQCTKCRFASKSRHNLIRHVTIKHSSDAPVYRCTECIYTTKWKYDLSTHINVHHNSHAELYRCPHCDYATKYKRSLAEHVKVQHDPNAKLYKCTSCDFATKHADYLAVHVTRRHFVPV